MAETYEGAGCTRLSPITQVLADLAGDVLRRTKSGWDARAASNWLAQEVNAPGQQEADGAIGFLEKTKAMDGGDQPPSTGYALGQVWRHLQPDLRAGLLERPPRKPVAAALVRFDEVLKRFSYGPPLRAAQ